MGAIFWPKRAVAGHTLRCTKGLTLPGAKRRARLQFAGGTRRASCVIGKQKMVRVSNPWTTTTRSGWKWGAPLQNKLSPCVRSTSAQLVNLLGELSGHMLEWLNVVLVGECAIGRVQTTQHLCRDPDNVGAPLSGPNTQMPSTQASSKPLTTCQPFPFITIPLVFDVGRSVELAKM